MLINSLVFETFFRSKCINEINWSPIRLVIIIKWYFSRDIIITFSRSIWYSNLKFWEYTTSRYYKLYTSRFLAIIQKCSFLIPYFVFFLPVSHLLHYFFFNRICWAFYFNLLGGLNQLKFFYLVSFFYTAQYTLNCWAVYLILPNKSKKKRKT